MNGREDSTIHHAQRVPKNYSISYHEYLLKVNDIQLMSHKSLFKNEAGLMVNKS